MSPERAVEEVMARYVRAVDARDSDGLVELFQPGGVERVFYSRNGAREAAATFEGRDGIRHALETLLPAHGPGEWAHHSTFDKIVRVDHERASIDAQFIVFTVEPSSPPKPQFAGYYEWVLTLVAGSWRIDDSTIVLTAPVDITDASKRKQPAA